MTSWLLLILLLGAGEPQYAAIPADSERQCMQQMAAVQKKLGAMRVQMGCYRLETQ